MANLLKFNRCNFIIFDAMRAPDWPYLSLCPSVDTVELEEDQTGLRIYICRAHLPPRIFGESGDTT